MSLASFPHFLDRPRELQIQIWRSAISSVEGTSFLDIGDLQNYSITHGIAYNMRAPGLLLAGPYTFRQIQARRSYPPNLRIDFRRFFGIMHTCRDFRLLSLEYWLEKVKEYCRMSPEAPATNVRFDRAEVGNKVQRAAEQYWSELRKGVMGVLEECIEQTRHAMRVDELKGGRLVVKRHVLALSFRMISTSCAIERMREQEVGFENFYCGGTEHFVPPLRLSPFVPPHSANT